MAATATDRASHLSLILDLSPARWYLSSESSNSTPLSLKTFLSHVLTFVNSHVALKPENTLALFGALPGKSVLIHSSENTEKDGDMDIPGDPNSYRPFKLVDSIIARNIEHELDKLDVSDDESPVALVGALTKALCHINRIHQASSDVTTSARNSSSTPEPRILILSVSADLSAAYIPVMNSIFSAQKLKVTIDVCKIFGPDTVFLQQAAHLTGGSYIHLEQREALLQYLIMSFLPPPSMRELISVPKQDKVDFRAACFCHKNIVDIAFVCSVCLSIFCSPVPVCSTCRTKFPIKSLQRLQAARPPAMRPADALNGSALSNGASPRRPVAPAQTSISTSLR